VPSSLASSRAFYARARAVRNSVARSPMSALSLGYYSRFRRHAPVTLALAHQYSFGMVAAYAWRRRRREHRLGARVDPDRRRSETGRCVRPNPTTDWGGDQGQGDATGLSALGWDQRDVRSSDIAATSRSSPILRLSRAISSVDQDPVCRHVCVVFCPRVDTWPPFCTPGLLFLRREPGASCVADR
jgi:hypothetical protein